MCRDEQEHWRLIPFFKQTFGIVSLLGHGSSAPYDIRGVILGS